MLFNILLFFLYLKGGTDMASVYVALIIAGRRTFSSVPSVIKEKVKEDLIALDLEELTK